jgi:hypothetical protein
MRRLSRPLSTPILFSALLLSWPAFYNAYPLVFSDTGTYLAQAMERFLGWDRPVFYSFFLLPLHWSLTLWPVIPFRHCSPRTRSISRAALFPRSPGGGPWRSHRC